MRVPLCIVSLILAAPCSAQVTATYATFGTGCNGTGTGYGANHVLPAARANSFGGSDNVIPFGWYPVKYQQVFHGTELPTAFTMAGLSLRQDERASVAHSFTVDMEIQVGYTTKTPATMSTTFAANFDAGTPVVVVPRAQIVFPDQPSTGPTDPSDFFLTIPFNNTFDWGPSPGMNFLVQVTVFGNSNGGNPWGYAFDATSGTARLYGSPANASSGVLDSNYGLVMGLRELSHTAVPVLYSTNEPQIGDTCRIRLAQARAASPALSCLGFSNTAWNGIPLPFDLAPLGAPGCRVLISVTDARPVTTNAQGAASFTYSIPNDIYLLRLAFYNQFVVADPGANSLGLALTNGGVGVIGNQ
jgi:hypothetical protein